jgi:hypothetical protein
MLDGSTSALTTVSSKRATAIWAKPTSLARLSGFVRSASADGRAFLVDFVDGLSVVVSPPVFRRFRAGVVGRSAVEVVGDVWFIIGQLGAPPVHVVEVAVMRRLGKRSLGRRAG